MNFSPTALSTLSGNTPIPEGIGIGGFNSASLTGGWTANRLVLIPFFTPAAFTISRFMVMPGSLAANFDLGIYDTSFNRLLSTGSFASSLSNGLVMQYRTGGNYKLQPGRYYFAFACDTGTGASQTIMQALTVAAKTNLVLRMAGVLQQDAGAFPLPATASPIALTTSVYPLVGISQLAS